MRLLDLIDVAPGTRVGHALLNDRGDVLVQSGVPLDTTLLASLQQRGYSSVVVDDAVSEGIKIQDPLSAETRSRAGRASHGVTTAGDQLIRQIGPEAEKLTELPRSDDMHRTISQGVPADDILAAAHAVVDEVLDAPTQLGLNSIKSRDSWAVNHAVEVAAIAVMLGRKWGLKAPELRRLGRGALLHDIGQVFTGDTVDGRTGPMSATDIDQVKRHTRLGYDFLQNVPEFDALMNHVAYQHHEWHNGKGYPRGLHGTDTNVKNGHDANSILLNAQITAIADVYDALCSDRPFRQRLPRELAISLLKRLAGSHLHPDLVRQFFELVPVFPPGYPVRIIGGTLDRWQGVVAKNGTPEINRPMVRLFTRPDGSGADPFEVDLARDPLLKLASVPPRRTVASPN